MAGIGIPKGKGGAFKGEVKSFNACKGYGFIKCTDSHGIHGKDVFMPKRALPAGGANAGDWVQFDVDDQPSGPIARNVSFLRNKPNFNIGIPNTPRADSGAVGSGDMVPWSGGYSDANDLRDGMDAGGGGGSWTDSGSGGGGGSWTDGAGGSWPGKGGVDPAAKDFGSWSEGYLGTVKVFNEQQGWGMITSPMVQQVHGRDVFFPASMAPGGWANAGEKVFFTMKMGPKGPAANSIEFIARGENSGSVGNSSSFGPPSCMGKGSGGGPPQSFFTGIPPSNGGSNSQTRYFGAISSFNEGLCTGSIECEACTRIYGQDVMFMQNDMPQYPSLGDPLSFTVITGPQGPQACEVRVLPPASFAVAGIPGVVYQGTIKSFNSGKKWGFITGAELNDIFGKDIFLNLREFKNIPNYLPHPGDEVDFTVQIEDNGGQPEAVNVKPRIKPVDIRPPSVKRLQPLAQPY